MPSYQFSIFLWKMAVTMLYSHNVTLWACKNGFVSILTPAQSGLNMIIHDAVFYTQQQNNCGTWDITIWANSGPLRWHHNGHDSVSPASRLFTQPFIRAQIKENIKAPRHWPLCGEFTGENVSIRWRHHAILLRKLNRNWNSMAVLLNFG